MYCYTVLILTSIISYMVKRICCERRYPKGYKKPQDITFKTSRVLDRARYRHDHDAKYDAVVIGAGPSGLATAALLSRLNWRVLVIEQNEVAGGGMHTFVQKGFEFETGLHYLGHDGTSIRLLDVITDTPIKFKKQGSISNDNVYDCIRIGGDELKLAAGIDNWLLAMTRKFPQDIHKIDRYLQEIKKVEHWHIAMYFRLKALNVSQGKIRWLQTKLCTTFFEISNITVYDKLLQLDIHPTSKLAQFLCGQYGDYGLLPSKASFFIHSAVVMHYINGGCFPIGGTGEIARHIIPTIQKSGGKVSMQANVTKLLLEENNVRGVLIDNVHSVKCPIVISSIGCPSTYQILSSDKKFPQPSCKFMYLFIGLEGYKGKLPEFNTWIYPHGDYDELENVLEDSPDGLIDVNGEIISDRAYFVASGSAKSGDWPEGKHSIVVLCNAIPHWYTQWDGTRHKDRERIQDYIEWKEAFGKTMLQNGLLKYIPDVEDYIVHQSVGTPLSTQHFIGSRAGEVYGISPEPKRWSHKDLLPRTTVNGLFLTGQDIVTAGIAGAFSSAELTANVVVGYGSLSDIFSQGDLIADLKKNE
jgi:all-trans-retinol 13,14-reductase